MKQLRLSAAILIVLIFFTMSLGIVAVQASEPKVPNPTPEFYCNDFANILNADTERDITDLGESTYESTDGGQVVFVSIDTLKGSTIEEYANTLFNKWKIGTSDKGILFILSIQERKSRIEVGYGYEGILTDIECNKLLVKFSELNEEEGIDEAVRTIYSDISSIVNGDTVQYPGTRETRRQESTGSSFFEENPISTVIFAIIVLILVILDFVFNRGRMTFFIIRMAAASSRRGGGGGRRNSGGGGRSGGGGSSSGF